MGKLATIGTTLGAALLLSLPVAARADDPARRACFADANRLCPAEVHSLSRHRVELCLAAHEAQTSPVCHAMIETIRAQRTAAAAASRGH
jgi:hypothetical protein